MKHSYFLSKPVSIYIKGTVKPRYIQRVLSGVVIETNVYAWICGILKVCLVLCTGYLCQRRRTEERCMNKPTYMKVAKKHLKECDVDQIGLTSENAHYKIIC